MDTSTFSMVAPAEPVAVAPLVESIMGNLPALTGVGIVAIVLIILAKRGDLRPLVDALAKLITETLAIWRTASKERSKNAQENARWRRRMRMARNVRKKPDLRQHLETVLALEKAADATHVEPGTDAPPPRGPSTTPCEVVELTEWAARKRARNQSDEPA